MYFKSEQVLKNSLKIGIMQPTLSKLPIIFSVFLLMLSQVSSAQKTAYDQLISVNQEWKNQPDADRELKQVLAAQYNEQELIKFHLHETEKLLRKRNTAQLTPQQKKRREANLTTLHAYWQKGVFPVNDLHVNRQPYFIDRFNTYCAVGYLMQQSGADEMARDIKRTQNYSYLADIDHPRLMKWVAASGLTIDELALIQPGYGGEWPATITEMHYNNTGKDVNEYIEVHQSNGGLIGLGGLRTILFYDYSGTLYKTLPASEMKGFYRNNTENRDSFYYYQFSATENFADSGKIELRGYNFCSPQILSAFTYNSSGIRLEEYSGCTPSTTVRQFVFKEDESTPVGSSLTFCGLYNSTWNPSILPATPGTLNPCTVGALPISLSSFNYNLNDKTVQLTWETVSESNNAYFEIEASTDGMNFHSIGRVNGAGNSNSLKKYSFTDNNPNYINHYRLKQIDKDGQFSYSKILFVKVAKANPLVLVQNAVKSNLQIQINTEQSNIGSLTIFDFSGRELLHLKGKNGSQNINVSSLSSGKYLIRLRTNYGQVYSRQFIK